MDEFTHQILLDWLGYRRTRWPDTANPHRLINQHSAMGHRASQHDLLRQDQTPRPDRGPGTTARRPATRGSPRPRTRPAAPGSGVRPRPQDRHPLRRERPPAPHHQGRRARPRQFPQTQGPERAIEREDSAVHREDPSVRLNSGISAGRCIIQRKTTVSIRAGVAVSRRPSPDRVHAGPGRQPVLIAGLLHRQDLLEAARADLRLLLGHLACALAVARSGR